MKQFLGTLFFSIIALCIIFLVVNLLESLDNFLDQNVSFITIVKYYLYFFPDILKILTPVATLLATLFTIGKLSTQNEITAMKSGGLSVYRLMIPFVFFTLGLSGFQVYFNGWIVPQANEGKNVIERKYLKKGSGTSINNLSFRESPYRNINMQYYDADNKAGNVVAIDEFSSESQPRLIKRIESKKMLWDSVDNAWKLVDGLERNFNGDRVEARKFDSTHLKLKITHSQIIQLKRSQEEMNFDERKDYIEILRSGGKDVRKQLIEYFGDYAFPFANFIIILFGIPFASVKKRGGIAIQIAAAMVVSFSYLVFTKVSQTIGLSSDFNPIIAGWMANVIFFFVGLTVLVKTKT